MPKGPTTGFSSATDREFAEQNAQRAMQATTYGLSWISELAEQNLSQTRALLERLLMVTRKAVDNVDKQGADFRHRSMLLAEETVSNAFDFAHKLVRAREPHELAQLQGEFVTRQAQVLIDQTNQLGQNVMQEANEMTQTAVQSAAELSSQRRSEAA